MQLVDLVAGVRCQALNLLFEPFDLFLEASDSLLELGLLVFSLAPRALQLVLELGNLLLELSILSDFVVKFLLQLALSALQLGL